MGFPQRGRVPVSIMLARERHVFESVLYAPLQSGAVECVALRTPCLSLQLRRHTEAHFRAADAVCSAVDCEPVRDGLKRGLLQRETTTLHVKGHAHDIERERRCSSHIPGPPGMPAQRLRNEVDLVRRQLECSPCQAPVRQRPVSPLHALVPRRSRVAQPVNSTHTPGAQRLQCSSVCRYSTLRSDDHST